MKNINLIIICFVCFIIIACAKGESHTAGNSEIREVIGLSNWTGHWEDLCSPGETLIFSITAKNRTQEFTIPADSENAFVEDIEEGDLIEIRIFNENGSLMLSGQKSYSPTNPELPSPALNGAPFIQVCEIGKLELFGF